jgi:hypothetical protein
MRVIHILVCPLGFDLTAHGEMGIWSARLNGLK